MATPVSQTDPEQGDMPGRLFNLNSLNVKLAHGADNASSSPFQMVCDLPDVGVSHLWVEQPSTNEDSSSDASQLSEAVDTSLVVFINGQCRKNGKSVSFGVFFGSDSIYNVGGLLPEGLSPTNQVADLHALKTALDTIRTQRTNNEVFKKITQVVIVSDSSYIINGMTKSIWKWEKNGYLTARKTPVANSEALVEVHGMIKDLEEKSVTVEFWHVDRKFNVHATTLAMAAFAGMEVAADAGSKKKRPRIRKKKAKKDSGNTDSNETPGFNSAIEALEFLMRLLRRADLID